MGSLKVSLKGLLRDLEGFWGSVFTGCWSFQGSFRIYKDLGFLFSRCFKGLFWGSVWGCGAFRV